MSMGPSSAKATPVSFAAASSLPTSATTSVVGISADPQWTGTVILAPIPPPHLLLPNRPAQAVQNFSPTDFLSELDYFRALRYPLTEIVGMAPGPAVRERFATEEAGVLAPAAETPATPVVVGTSTENDTGIPSWERSSGHRLLVGDADKREAVRESGQVGLFCFTS